MDSNTFHVVGWRGITMRATWLIGSM